MKPWQITMFVSPMGHDVNRISALCSRWLTETGLFRVEIVGECPAAKRSIEDFMEDPAAIAATDLFYFVCSDDHWHNPRHQKAFEEAVAGGIPVFFSHGLHPCFRDWPEIEKMIGLLWREEASHGDFDFFDVRMTEEKHPITEGVEGFHTKEELFCALTNVWNVPLQVLVTAHSPAERISRHAQPGTGNEEPLLTLGNYGQARIVDFILGHVWTHYTGHGLLENTTIAFEPPQVKTLLLRSCEWAITGKVEATK